MHLNLPLGNLQCFIRSFSLGGEQEEEGNPSCNAGSYLLALHGKEIHPHAAKTNQTAQLSLAEFSLPPSFQTCMYRDLCLCADSCKKRGLWSNCKYNLHSFDFVFLDLIEIIIQIIETVCHVWNTKKKYRTVFVQRFALISCSMSFSSFYVGAN